MLTHIWPTFSFPVSCLVVYTYVVWWLCAVWRRKNNFLAFFLPIWHNLNVLRYSCWNIEKLFYCIVYMYVLRMCVMCNKNKLLTHLLHTTVISHIFRSWLAFWVPQDQTFNQLVFIQQMHTIHVYILTFVQKKFSIMIVICHSFHVHSTCTPTLDEKWRWSHVAPNQCAKIDRSVAASSQLVYHYHNIIIGFLQTDDITGNW